MMTSQSSKQGPRINEIGFSILHDPKDAIVDIVFVHGLQGHPRRTWTCEKTPAVKIHSSGQTSDRGVKKLFSWKHKASAKDIHKTEDDEVFWPLDLLPEDCSNARIMTWGYDSMVSHFFGGATNQSNITAHVRNLLQALKINRTDCGGRKLIFIAHSLGGIIVKDVFRRAASDANTAILDIFTSTVAIVFLGTPHRGSNKARLAETVRRVVSVSGFDTTDKNIRALKVDSTELELLHELFMNVYEQKDRHFIVLTFQEGKGVAGINYLKLNERVVEPFSSSISTEPTQTINANHMSMCRFPSREDEGYKQVVGEIKALIREIEILEEEAQEKRNSAAKVETGSQSQPTIASTTYSLNDTERMCIAVLTQNTSNAAEYKSTLPIRVEGTCQWILTNSQYRNWNSKKETCLLWISGYPGSGKTILSAYLLEYLGAGNFSPSLRSTLCYFFCDDKIDTQKDGMAILRSLIHQLLQRRRMLIKYIKAAYDIHGPHFDQNFTELWRIFVAIASDKRVGPVSVIVDAIDECEEITRERFLQDVIRLESQARSADSKTPCIKFLVTSRPLLGRRYTTNLLQLDPSESYVEQDLRLVIQAKVDGIVLRTKCKPDVRRYLEDALFSKADRTFLWVTLVLHLLENSLLASQKDFKRIIDELPKTLTATYERFLNEIPGEYQALAAKLLHLLVGSSRPLSLEEMKIAIAMQTQTTLAAVEEDSQPNIRETIEGILGPLVRIWDSRIYLVHQSLKDFLGTLPSQKDNPLATKYGIDPSKANLFLAEACVSYLLLDEFKNDLFSRDQSSVEDSPISPVSGSEEVETIEEVWDPFQLGEDTLFKDPITFETEACVNIATRYPFFDYCARCWAEHFLSASTICSAELQKSVLLLSDATHDQGLNWFRYYWLHTERNLPLPSELSPIVISCYFGHLSSLRILSRDENTIESEIMATGLFWAARMGHVEIVDFLLSANINPDEKIVDGQNALTAAVQFDRLSVVKRLLKDDGFISENRGYRVNHESTGGRTTLSIAAGNGLIETVRELLKHPRIQPDIADFDKWTPLFWSIGGKHLDVLQLLITDDRVSLNHVDRTGRNVLSWAASAGEVELVRYLMSLNHLSVDEPDRTGRSPLSWAAGSGHLETTALLRRSKRVDPSWRDNDGRNALSWACSGGHHRVVEYLIKHNRQGIDQEDVDGWTPLAWALFSQAPKTVQVLVDSGFVDVNKKDRMGRSALSFAAGYGYSDVVQILLKAEGIEINSMDNDGNTPLAHAERNPDIAKILQDIHIS